MAKSELWREIPGHPNYEASSLGRIRSIDRIEPMLSRVGTPCCRRRKGRILRQAQQPNGYVRVSMYKHSYESVHRLVAMTFLLRQDGQAHVNHLDGDKKNNHPDNLSWCTVSENELHSYRVLGKQVWNKRISDSQAIEIRRRIGRGAKQVSLAKEFGVSKCTISAIHRGRSHKRAKAGSAARSAKSGHAASAISDL